MTNLATRPDRDVRQRDLVPPAALAAVQAVVIGVGAVGRQAALQLAAMGVPRMTLFDPDTVGVENLAVQGFRESDIGTLKVHAVADLAREQFPLMELRAVPERFRRGEVRTWSSDWRHAVFCCVDSIETRRVIWESVRERAAFLADGRAAAEVIRVLASDRPASDKAYGRTLFAGAEAYVGACTARMTIYAASITAGLMLAQFARWLRGQPVTPDQTLNLLAAELTVADATI